MAKVISTHSFRGGTGKSNITANIAVQLARRGQKVGIFDGDIQSPGIHILFNLSEPVLKRTINDYLWGDCPIQDAVYKVFQDPQSGGSVVLVPASIKPNDIARILREGYDANDMHRAYQDVVVTNELDYLLIDTHPGLNEETLLSITASHTLLIMLRPDQQDFQGTSVTVEIARRLRVEEILLVVNKIPPIFDMEDIRGKVERIYQCPVVGMLNLSNELAQNASARPYSLEDPQHPFSLGVMQIVDRLNGVVAA